MFGNVGSFMHAYALFFHSLPLLLCLLNLCATLILALVEQEHGGPVRVRWTGAKSNTENGCHRPAGMEHLV